MNKIYYVMIKGRTLESRNLKHLLSRAVAEKRNMDHRSNFSTPIHGYPAADNGRDNYRKAC
jgi:hypothetical protein